MFEFSPADHAAVSSASKILRSRYRDFVAYEDVAQECYLWLFSNYHKAERWREDLSERHAERTLVKALRNAGERYCRAEKAEREGYLTEDEFFYSIPMVADLLQLSFDPEWMVPNGVEVGVRPSNNPQGEGGDLNALVADVTRGYRTLPAHDQELLARVYEHGTRSADNVAVLALEWDITTKAADMRVRRVLGRLRASLGGPSPYRQDA
jgi:hypothetical protein